jgi:hypothetical protein
MTNPLEALISIDQAIYCSDDEHDWYIDGPPMPASSPRLWRCYNCPAVEASYTLEDSELAQRAPLHAAADTPATTP